MGKTKVAFLGGTAANNNWRDGIISDLVGRGVLAESLFNPVVPEWTDAAAAREEQVKVTADYLVFYIADPKQEGNPLSAYSMLEATMALYDHPGRTIVVFDTEGMAGHPLKAMKQGMKVLKARHPEATILGTRQEIIDWLAKNLVA